MSQKTDFMEVCKVLVEHKSILCGSLTEFVELNHRIIEAGRFKFILDQGPLTRAGWRDDELGRHLPDEPDASKRLVIARQAVAELESLRDEAASVLGWIFRVRLMVLLPLGTALGLGRPDDYAESDGPDAAQKFATRIRRYVDDILVLTRNGNASNIIRTWAEAATAKRRVTGKYLRDKPMTDNQRDALGVLLECKGIKTEAARRLGISRQALDDRLKGVKLRGEFSKRRSVASRSLPHDRRGQPIV